MTQPTVFLAQANARREGGDLRGAAENYRRYLAARPGDWPIRVQFGHVLRDLGDLRGAVEEYARAGATAPEEWDPPFQEGHTLRLLGRGGEAARRLRRALLLAPDHPEIRREDARIRHRLEQVPDAPPAPFALPPEGPPTQFAFDVTDLLDYLRDARTRTGIQRVQMGLLGGTLEQAAPPAPVILVAYEASTWRWWLVEADAFRAALALSRTGAEASDPAWRAATARLCAADRQPDAPLQPGATLASLGNAWGIEDYFRGLRVLRRAVPLRYAAFVHDCVPILMPEHCLDETTRYYARWFAALALHADLLLANSRSTAADVVRFAAPLGRVLAPRIVPLAAEPPPDPAEAAEALEAFDPGGFEEPFILFVATIESRKNHLMVFQAWVELLRRFGPDRTPRLVCVGRPGWRSEAALGLLERSPPLRNAITLLSGVSDMALAGLTGRCLFTVYNSFHEGWGLPVSESLAAGKLCVTPAHSGLLESGAPGAVFFPAGDLPALVDTLAGLIADPDRRAALEARIDRSAATRPWRVAAEEVLAALAVPHPAPEPRPGFPLGERLPMGAALPPPGLAGAWAEAIRDGLGWWSQEGWGVWMRDGVATLLIPLGVPAGVAIRVLLELRAPPGGLMLRLRTRGAATGPWRRLRLDPGSTVTVALQTAAGADGIAVDLDAGDGAALGDGSGRVVGAGLVAVTTCREDDLSARLAALERAAA